MPTPVAAARQCLTQESAAVLDEAVAVARRRGHAQTTSLHMVSSLLSLPNSSLREACTRTRSNAYSTRVQFKALELSLSVSLDRLPSSHAAKSDAPPVSNSLMAAVKRSQANQRRQPENFSFYQQQQQQYSSSSSSSSSSSVPLVKVELQNLIVSILDDPLVSRVFGEAGFRSCDIKMATLRPGNILGCTSRYKRANPPLFLCNLRNENINACGPRGFSFPFMGCFAGSDDNSRRIGEVMLREKKKCPLLLGVSATDALARFLESVRNKGSDCGLPDGIWVECVRGEISRYLNGDCDDGALKLRFERVEREAAERGAVVVDFGDLGALAGDGDDRRLKFLVGNLGRLVEVHRRRKLWLIGTATTYEVYFKILKRFPSIEEDWELGVLPITSSFNFSMGGASSYPRSSLMESFVPLGGFFSVPPETKTPLSNACQLCNDKYEQEVAAVSNAEKHQSWLQTAEAGLTSLKGTDGRMLLRSKIAALRKKWDSICQQHHQHRAHTTNHIPRVLGFQLVNGTGNGYNANSIESSVDEQGSRNASSIVSTHDLRRSSSLKELSSSDVPPKENNHHLHHLIKSPNLDSSTASVADDDDDDDRASPTSVSGLALHAEAFAPHASKKCHSDSGMLKDPKMLYRALHDRVGHQEEALRSIVETITQPGDDGGTMSPKNVWINVRGGDGLSKRKLGLALAEILYGSSESLVYIDLSFPEAETTTSSHVDALLNSQITSKYDVTMRATVVDYLVDKLSKKPCVVFLDNVDRADLVVQNSLSQAVRSGRFTDWCGREANVSNCIFIGATKTTPSRDEEDALRARPGTAIQIVVRFDMSDDHNTVMTTMNKRSKLDGWGRSTNRPHKPLDLNLNLNLVDDEEGSEIRGSESDSEKAGTWMERFEREVDLTVDFKEFDFSELGEKILRRVEECVKSVVGCECAVEVEREAMQQINGAAYLYGVKRVEKWIDEVVRKGFEEGMGKYSITGRSIVRLIKGVGVGVGEERTQGLLPARVTMK